jgi:hypothetical protein
LTTLANELADEFTVQQQMTINQVDYNTSDVSVFNVLVRDELEVLLQLLP